MIVRCPERPRCTVLTNTTAGSARAARSAKLAGALATGTIGEVGELEPDLAADAAVPTEPCAAEPALAAPDPERPSQAVSASDSIKTPFVLMLQALLVQALRMSGLAAARARVTAPSRPRRSAF